MSLHDLRVVAVLELELDDPFPLHKTS